MSNLAKDLVIVHPTVLLSIVDNFTHDTRERVIGVILGSIINDQIHITNCYALPFEEHIDTDDEKSTWYYDTTYKKRMFSLIKKINSHEEVIGWYHTGPGSVNDLEITDSFRSLVTLQRIRDNDNEDKGVYNPLLLSVNVKESKKGNPYPIRLYGIDDNNEFYNVESRIEAEESEEVGVEHLLREIRDETEGYMKDQVKIIKNSLLSYKICLKNIVSYLDQVMKGEKVANQEILFEIQECMNSIPKMKKIKQNAWNDVYVSCLTKNVVKLRDLIKNRSENETVYN